MEKMVPLIFVGIDGQQKTYQFLGRKSIKPFTIFRCNEVHKQNYVGLYNSVVIY